MVRKNRLSASFSPSWQGMDFCSFPVKLWLPWSVNLRSLIPQSFFVRRMPCYIFSHFKSLVLGGILGAYSNFLHVLLKNSQTNIFFIQWWSGECLIAGHNLIIFLYRHHDYSRIKNAAVTVDATNLMHDVFPLKMRLSVSAFAKSFLVRISQLVSV